MVYRLHDVVGHVKGDFHFLAVISIDSRRGPECTWRFRGHVVDWWRVASNRASGRGVAGNRSLFVNHQFTVGLEGWAPEESAPLLQLLWRKQTEPAFVHRHRWRVGDLVVWDNRQTLHHGVFDVAGAATGRAGVRRLHRTTAAYERPIAVGGQGLEGADSCNE